MTGNGLVRGVLVLIAASGVFAATAGAADEKDVVGRWKLKYEPGDGQTHEPVLTVTKNGTDLKAEFVEGDQRQTVKDVRYKDGELSVKVESKYNDESVSVTYRARPEGDALKGDATWEYQGMSGTFPFEGKRQTADRAPEAAPPPPAQKAAKEIPLYPGAAPGSEKWDWKERSATSPLGHPIVMDVVRPMLLHYPAEKGKAVGAAMIVAPGGGFRVLMMSYEGEDIGRRLNAMGVDAFVLKYRLIHGGPGAPGGAANRDAIKLAADDGRQAVRLVRERAGEFGYRPDRVGMIGFSAGGMVTSEALFGPAETRPDFAAIIYGAREIKEVPSPAPPLFLAVAADDALAAGRTVELFTAYRKGKNPAELHVFQTGAHGFLNKGGGADHFMDRLEEWLGANKLLSKPAH